MNDRFRLLLYFLFEFVFLTSSRDVPPSSTIINGVRAEKGEFPYIVGVFATSFAQRQYFGGGSILADKWVISSRHVAYVDDYLKYTPRGLRGKVYENQLKIVPNYDNTMEALQTGYKYAVEKRFCHPKVNQNTDFVLLKLTQAIPLNGSGPGNFSAIPIADPEEAYDVESVVAAGWGANNGQIGVPTQYLMQTKLKVLQKDDQCFSSTGNRTSICFGDSGGPGVIRNDDKDALIGIAAYVTHTYCKKNSLFINVSTIRSWIEAVMNYEPYKYECKNVFGPLLVNSSNSMKKKSQLLNFFITFILVRTII